MHSSTTLLALSIYLLVIAAAAGALDQTESSLNHTKTSIAQPTNDADHDRWTPTIDTVVSIIFGILGTIIAAMNLVFDRSRRPDRR